MIKQSLLGGEGWGIRVFLSKKADSDNRVCISKFLCVVTKVHIIQKLWGCPGSLSGEEVFKDFIMQADHCNLQREISSW